MANYLTSSDPLLVIIGPSGSGKSSVIRQLYQQGMIEITPTWTTRPPRPGETDESIEHKFVDDKTFQQKVAAGFFLNTKTMFGLEYHYGLPRIKQPAGHRVPVIVLRAALLPLLAKFYSNFTIYQIVDDPKKIANRLISRQAAGEKLGKRFDDNLKEIELGKNLANRIFCNQDNLRHFTKEVADAIRIDFPDIGEGNA